MYSFSLDTDSGLTRQRGGIYLDRYRKTNEGWRIVESICCLHSLVNGRHLEVSNDH